MMMRTLCVLLALGPVAWTAKKEKPPELSPLDRYVQEALKRPERTPGMHPSAGSIWQPGSRLTDLGSDLRARQVDDMVTVLVVERASALSKGAVKTARQSQVKSNVAALAGITKAAGPLANLAQASNDTQLQGEGATTRETLISTRLAGRVTHVLPNGYLVVEGIKEVQVNSERQLVTVRGVVRPADLSPDNVVRSDAIAQLEVRVNGKGVVGDSIRRPFFLYRLLLGLLPF